MSADGPPASPPWLRLELPRGNAVEVRMRARMPAADFARLAPLLLQLAELSFVEDEPSPDAADDA